MKDDGRQLSIIEAPTDLGLTPNGVSELPAALRAAGLFDGVPRVHDAARLTVPPYSGVRESHSGVLNADGVRRFSSDLASVVSLELDQSRFPVVLGGDCSLLLGVGLALQQHGQNGLLFVDGHSDFYSPETEPNGELASMELTAVTGRLPALTHPLSLDPMFADSAVVVLGYRDGDDAAARGSPDVRDTGMTVFDLTSVRDRGVNEVAQAAPATWSKQSSGDSGCTWIQMCLLMK